jgi:outer membrane protein assembly factor BamB
MPILPNTNAAIVTGLGLTLAVSAGRAGDGTVNWPQFRGPNASGVGEGYDPPTAWDVPKGENVLWKTAIAGLGHSSAIVWGGRVFVTTAISGRTDADLRVGLYGDIAPVQDDTKHSFRVYCLDKGTGKILWEQTAVEAVPRIKRHTKATHANSTPATDGQHVVAFFGSEGLYCYDMDGKLQWKRDFGVLNSGYYVVPDAQWGFGSSPVIHDGQVIVQCDVLGNSFIAALDVETGSERWRTPRDEVPTWSTPTIYLYHGAPRIAVNGYKHIGGYDLATGNEVWKLRGGGDIPVPTPIVAHDLVFIGNAHGAAAPIYAVRTGATGDITLPERTRHNEHIAWSNPRGAPYMQTMLVYDDFLYYCRDNGIFSCADAKTGEIHYGRRLGEGRTGFTASPIAANGKVYFTSEEGDVHVVKVGTEYEVLSVNPLGEVCMATPAFSEGQLFFRTQGHVVAIGKKAAAVGD